MFKELKEKAKKLANVTVIKGDANQLTQLLKKYNEIIEKPVLLLLQNTLGTVIGNPHKILMETKKMAKRKREEIILSLFCQESLKRWGIRMYARLQSMIGEMDIQKTDFNHGIFISKTGYKSKW